MENSRKQQQRLTVTQANLGALKDLHNDIRVIAKLEGEWAFIQPQELQSHLAAVFLRTADEVRVSLARCSSRCRLGWRGGGGLVLGVLV